jgi:amino acid adenylation domain-containing protein
MISPLERSPSAGPERLDRLFASQVARTPEAVALVWGTERLTYSALSRRADRLARRLVAAGAGPEVAVALFLPRTANLVTAMLATLAAGAFYVPIDPAYPEERRAFLLADSGARLLVTTPELAERAPAGVRQVWVEERADSGPLPALPAPAGEAANLAYVIYTSGSTGRPKAVAIAHASAALLVRWAQAVFSPAERAAVLAATSIAFDLSVFEIFVPLATGGTVVLADNALALPELPARDEVTLLNTVPSGLAELLRFDALPPAVRTVNLAGEALSRALADRVYARPGVARLYNLYGPSEDTTYSTCALVERESGCEPAIGRPLDGTTTHVLGPSGEPLPVAEPGELYLGGASLARGYLGRPELTAERFLPDPFALAPGARLYRTGDRVRRRPGGELEFLGRLDRQVKIRGFRVELGEVEAALAACPGVDAAAVLARREGGGELRLVAYVAPPAPSVTDLRAALERRLPAWMIPSAWVFLPALPLTPNGKVDRPALPAPAPERPALASAEVAPRDPVEQLLAEVWAEVLGLSRVGIRDDFFDLGGDSIRALQVVARCRKRGLAFTSRQLFDRPTIASLRETLAALGPEAPLPRTPGAAGRESYPLTPGQHGLLTAVLLSGNGSRYYFEQDVLTLSGRIDPIALKEAWQQVVDRHPALSTRFVWEGRERPLQVVERDVELPWQELDWRGLPAGERTARLENFLRQDHARGFDLGDLGDFGQAPLLRLALVHWEEGVAQLVWSFHHLILDGWSISLVLAEVQASYAARLAGRAPELPPARPFGDYVAWLERQDPRPVEELWRRALSDLPAPSPLPFDEPGPDGPDGDGWITAEEGTALPAATWAALSALARRHRLTPNTLFQGAWGLLLARTAGAPEALFGSVVAGRPEGLPGVESIVGMFVHALPVRVRCAPAVALLPWLAELQEGQVEARRLPPAALEELQAWAGVPRGRALFESLLAFQSFPAAPFGREGEAAWEIRRSRSKEATPAPLALYAEPAGETVSLLLSYHRHRFTAAAARRLLALYTHLLAGFAACPEARLAEIPFLPESEQQELLAGGRGPVAQVGAATILDLFTAQAVATPDAVAIEAGEERLSYAELAARVESLAAHLREVGVSRGEVVGIGLERSLDLTVALLAAWRAGAAYLPLDPAYPAERLAFMVADARVRVLLTTAALAGRLPAAAIRVELRSALPLATRAGRQAARRLAEPMGSDPAYILYTSGSTGMPKGVVVPHAALANYVADAGQAYEVAPGDRVLQFASASFDTSAEEIYPCLTRGATLVLRGAAAGSSFAAFLAEVEVRGITLLDLPTAYWHELVADLGRQDAALPASVRLVVIGGEEAQAGPLSTWRDRVGGRIRLLNTYGPTEATIVATRHDLTATAAGSGAPIGRAVGGVRAYVLGAAMELLPPGLDGELWIGGAGLARGYLGRPEQTAERFRPDPFAALGEGLGGPGERLYRTGDRARLLPDGSLLFRGRVDGQVKVRGFRVEPGEVEAALLRLPGVGDAAVVLQEGGGAGQRLAAFVVPSASPEVPKANTAARALREGLRAVLPEHMVPALFVTLPALPLTPSGKVDRADLACREEEPEPGEEGRSGKPRTPVEEVLAGIWSELLGVEVGVDDGFFALGGHSLLAAQALSRIRQALGVEVPLPELFTRPTVALLAAWIEEGGQRHGQADLPPLPPLLPVPRDGRPLPASFAQERVWFLDQLAPGGNRAYNFQVALRLRGPLDLAALERSLSEIVRRHEVLRTSFPEVGGLPVQVIHPAAPRRLPVIDLSGLPPAVGEERAEALIEGEIRIPFDLSRGPLLRWRLLRHGERFHTLVQVEHHFVHDGWSLAILLGELEALYAAYRQGLPSPLPEPPVQYADYAVWQREWLRGETLERLLGFWRERLAGAPPALEIATDRPRPAQGSFRGDLALLPIAPELYESLRRFGRGQGFTLYMVMLAGFLALLNRYTGETDLVIGTSNANRRARELEGMIGMMVNSLVLRADLAGRPSFRELLSRTRALALATHAHQDMPFERLVQELRLERRPGRNPLFQIMFNFHDAPVPEFRSGDLELFPEVRGNRTAKLDLNLIVVPRAEQRVGRGADLEDRDALLHLEYNTDLFDRETVARLAAHYQTLLEGALADPGRALPELPLLTPAERAEVLERWNATASDYPAGSSIPKRFAVWAARTPGATAVAFGEDTLTYADLDAWSNRLAHHLRALGVGAGDLVALAVERSLELVPVILGVLKSGAAYLPLDPGAPPERLAFLIEDSGARLLLGQERCLARLPATGRLAVALEGDWLAIARAPAAPVLPLPGPDDLAYVMYTSGSTGRPKGVAATHKNVLRLVLGSRFARFGPREVFLQLAPLSFDASTLELWGPLLNGGRLAIFPPESPSLASLGEAIARHGVTTLWLTAGLFHQMVDGNLSGLRPLSQLLAGGDALQPAQVRRALAGLPGLSLVNGYGPTEGTTFTCCHPLSDPAEVSENVPIGRPIANARVYVVDGELRPLPVGVPGELSIGGDGLAVGYLHRPALTAERFVPDPFAVPSGVPGVAGGEAGGRLYRTGDRVRWRPDGTLEFLGRLDRQVKIRGFRVEPGEVEAALAEHPAVGEAVVLALLEPGEVGERRLVAYVVPREAGEGSELAAVLHRHLAAKLPAFLLPAAWKILPELPLTPRGKVDRGALERVSPAAPTAGGKELALPETPAQKMLAAIWSEVLGVERVGLYDDFFFLGGHSLSALRVLSRLRRELGVELPLSDLFAHPRLADLAAVVGAAAVPEERGVEEECRAFLSDMHPESLSEDQLDALLRALLEEGDR